MADKVTISVDALGGDNAPDVVLDGVEAALAEDGDLSVILCGPAEIVEPFAAAHDRCVARATTEVISMAEHPANAVRRKKDSSIVVGCRLVKEGEAQGFFSAGSTGACLAAATLVMGRIKGVARPALATLVPSPAKPVVLCDVGANADCKPEYLVQFAQMGSIYMRNMTGVEKPRVGLVNVGTEEEKGNELAKQAHQLLKNCPDINFVGNIEAREIPEGAVDVAVTDAFTGNAILKMYEGVAKVILHELKGALMSTFISKIGALMIKPALKGMIKTFDASEYGGAPMLGLKGLVVKAHGNSKEAEIEHALEQCITFKEKQINDLFRSEMKLDELASARRVKKNTEE